MNQAGFCVLACCFCLANHNELCCWPQLQQSKDKWPGIEDFFQRRKTWYTTSSLRSSDQWPVILRSRLEEKQGRPSPQTTHLRPVALGANSAIRYIAHTQRKVALYSPFPSLSAALHHNCLPWIELKISVLKWSSMTDGPIRKHYA